MLYEITYNVMKLFASCVSLVILSSVRKYTEKKSINKQLISYFKNARKLNIKYNFLKIK